MAIFKLDPTDAEGMCRIMDEFCDEPGPFSGTDEEGNPVLISVNKDNITVQTFQKNDWIRTNVYNRYGENEEFYEHA